MTARTLFLAAAAVADLSLLTLFANVRTNAPLLSPWELVSPFVFVVFGLGTAVLWLAIDERPDGWLLAGLCLHAGVAASASALVYAISFGFDPLLHQAAERIWSENGIPHDASILYSGQYALVSLLGTATRIPVFSIDRWLVPMLASITPLVTISGLRSAWKLPPQRAYRATFALFLVPFVAFTFTIPYHLGVIIFLWTIAWLPTHHVRVQLVLLLGSLATLSIHPLIGLPTILLVLGRIALFPIQRPMLRRIGWVLCFCVMSMALPAAFLFLYRSRLSEVIDWAGLLHPAAWLGLFRDPYPFAGWGWENLYLFRLTIPLCIVVGAGMVTWRAFPEQRRMLGLLWCGLSGLTATTYLLATLFRFPDVIAYEQYEFPLRLIQLLPLATYPFIGLAVVALHNALSGVRARAGLTLAVASLSAIAWFFSYPQFNAKAFWSGPSASAQDMAIVSTIETHASGTPYVALAAPITSALAVRTFGFREVPGGMLWYPLPTGAALYPYYLRLSQAPDPSLAHEAALLSGVQRIYVVRDRTTSPVDNVSSEVRSIPVPPYGILIDIYDTP